jgi:hypothetical protein
MLNSVLLLILTGFMSITVMDFITTEENTFDNLIIILGIILIGLFISIVSGLLIKKYSNRGLS